MPEDGPTNVTDSTPVDDGEAKSIPGFGLILSITAVLGASLVTTRRE